MNDEQRRDVEAALLAYWTSRDEAALAQAARGGTDMGGRAGVTSGGHLDRVAQLFGRVCVAAGVPASRVYYAAPAGDPLRLISRQMSVKQGVTLPGYFRPTKQWDVVVYGPGGMTPIAAIELKSQNGPSFGNNANNRAEEAIGNAVDLLHGQRSGVIPGGLWTGYAYVIEDAPGSRKPSGARDSTALPKHPDFKEWSYQSRVSTLCERLVEEGYYSAAWAVAASKPVTRFDGTRGFEWRELTATLGGYAAFVESLTTHLGSHYGEVEPHAGVSLADRPTLL